MPILTIPLGIKLGIKLYDKDFPQKSTPPPNPEGGRGKDFSPRDVREKLPPGWRPPKTSTRKSRPKSTRPKKTENFPRGGSKTSSEVLAKLLQPIIRGFLTRKKYKPLLDTVVIFPLKKKNKRLQRLRVLAELA